MALLSAADLAEASARFDDVAGALETLKRAAGAFARDPSDRAAAGEAIAAAQPLLDLFDRGALAHVTATQPIGDVDALIDSAPALRGAVAGIVALTGTEPVDDARAVAKPLSVWLRGAANQMKGIKRELAELSAQEASSRAEAEILAARRGRL